MNKISFSNKLVNIDIIEKTGDLSIVARCHKKDYIARDRVVKYLFEYFDTKDQRDKRFAKLSKLLEMDTPSCLRAQGDL